MAECNAKQADFIVGARVLPNPRGTAPGFWGSKDGVEIVALPGVPSEMKEIMEDVVLPDLRARAGDTVGRRRVLRIAGMGESAVEELVAPVYARWKDDPVTILASPGEVQLHLFARGEPRAAETKLAAMERDFRAALGERIYGADSEDLAAVVGGLLAASGKTLALAESCTGGLASSMLTDVPGSSRYFLGSVVSYANSAKADFLGVRPETLAAHGAVSAEAAREMALGARERFGAEVALAITGIAGPDGGTPEKPVGTVFFALTGLDGEGRAETKRRQFGGDRGVVRRASCLHAFEMLRRRLGGRTE
jgi:nicotinamide-nucleotide amidase